MPLPLLDHLASAPARAPLGAFPSPVESHPELAAEFGLTSLVVKRDDLNGTAFGGNKLRALEWLLPAAGPAIVTMGGYGSTWCAALATAAPPRGQAVHAALFPQPWTDRVAGALATTLRGGTVHLAHRRIGLPLAIVRALGAARASGPTSWIPAGGAEPIGVLGSVNAALEFAQQMDDARLPRPDAIVVPLGSGGTAAGLLIGFQLARWPVQLCAVRVTDPWFAHRRRVLALARATSRLLRRHGATMSGTLPPLRVIGDQLGPGYGHPTPPAEAALACMARVGITLDLTYGAKACAALTALAPSFRRLCFWHTFDPRLASPTAVPHPLLAIARTRAESLWPQPKST